MPYKGIVDVNEKQEAHESLSVFFVPVTSVTVQAYTKLLLKYQFVYFSPKFTPS